MQLGTAAVPNGGQLSTFRHRTGTRLAMSDGNRWNFSPLRIDATRSKMASPVRLAQV